MSFAFAFTFEGVFDPETSPFDPASHNLIGVFVLTAFFGGFLVSSSV